MNIPADTVKAVDNTRTPKAAAADKTGMMISTVKKNINEAKTERKEVQTKLNLEPTEVGFALYSLRFI